MRMRVGYRHAGSARSSGRMLLFAFALLPLGAQAFGVLGHRVAERVADSLLCTDAAAAVERFGDGASLVGLGEWADRIRSDPRWEHTASWHYLNVADDRSVAEDARRSSAHVLWAIRRFAAELANETLDVDRRSEALRFLVHFVVDIHQPLHVGRADDRGGNDVALWIGGRRTNLHRLWDTGILERSRRDERRLGSMLVSLARAEQRRWQHTAPDEWASESKALREFVYDFEPTPSTAYLDAAVAVLDRRLAQAGVRLAYQLNSIFCGWELR